MGHFSDIFCNQHSANQYILTENVCYIWKNNLIENLSVKKQE